MDARTWVIRPARTGEHEMLTELALRSVQRVWNYADDFMAWEPEAITVAPSQIAGAIVSVLEEGELPIGFSMLQGEPPEIELSRLMIEPDRTGTGAGRRLWEHAVATARALGCNAITLDADPNAEPFYRHMGAVTIGEHDWEPPMMPGWRVKQLRFVIPDVDHPANAGVASSPDSRENRQPLRQRSAGLAKPAARHIDGQDTALSTQ